MGRIIVDFLGISILVGLVMAILTYFIPSLDSPGGSVSTVVAAMMTGHLYGLRTGEEVSSGFAWKVALILTLVSLVLASALLWVASAMEPSLLPEGLSVQALAISLLFVGLLCLLVIRFTFRFSVKLGTKAKTK